MAFVALGYDQIGLNFSIFIINQLVRRINCVCWPSPCERLSGVMRKSPTANGWVVANDIKKTKGARAN